MIRSTLALPLALGIRSRYPWAMISRCLVFTIILFGTSPALSSDLPKADSKTLTEKRSPRTWNVVAAHILKNGKENLIKAPTSHTLGYGSDAVPARSLRIKSSDAKDKKEHSIRATYSFSDKGDAILIDLVLGTTFVEVVPEGKKIDAFGLRISADGRIISAMRATGLVGKVEQTALGADSKKAKEIYESEKLLLLKTIKLEQLTQ